jgi:YD repeat-containing protein
MCPFGQLRPHAAISTSKGGDFQCDSSGNMTGRRLEAEGVTYTQGWDAENRLISVTAGGTTTQLVYDGDGNLVKKVAGAVMTVYVGAYFEKNLSTGVTTSYYYAGSTRVAMRKGGVVSYLHGDHLGSASLATNSSGAVVANSSTRYYPYGAMRSGGSRMPTDYRFTGQRTRPWDSATWGPDGRLFRTRRRSASAGSAVRRYARAAGRGPHVLLTRAAGAVAAARTAESPSIPPAAGRRTRNPFPGST